MYDIFFYRDKDGNEPVYEYLKELRGKNDKDSRIKSTKILDYIEVLRRHGKSAGEPYIKHLEDDIWEIRPLRDRILFAAWVNNSFVLLHHFVKKTQKTPRREIVRAKRLLADFKERMKYHE